MCVCKYVYCVCFFLQLQKETVESQISIKANHFLHLQAYSLFQQGELTNKSHPSAVHFVWEFVYEAHPVGYCPAIAIQKHKARRWLHLPHSPLNLQHIWELQKANDDNIVTMPCLNDNAVSLQLPHISDFCAFYTYDSQSVQLKCSCKTDTQVVTTTAPLKLSFFQK